jgi:hypothetical protein
MYTDIASPFEQYYTTPEARSKYHLKHLVFKKNSPEKFLFYALTSEESILYIMLLYRSKLCEIFPTIPLYRKHYIREELAK